MSFCSYRDFTRPDLGSGAEGEVQHLGPNRVPDIATALAGRVMYSII